MIRLTIGALAAALATIVVVPGDHPVRTLDARSMTTGDRAAVGPPWISIEYPVNPHDATTRDAFLLVHAFHHGTPMQFPVTGTAEGLVNGQRRSVSLELTRTSRPGVYALRKQWASEGVWTLVITVRQGETESAGASAVVDLAPSGEIASVKVPTRRQGQWLIPEPVQLSAIDASLRQRATALARR